MSLNDEKKTPENEKDGRVVFRRKGFQFLGMGLQDYIRVFFGGNASLAIIVLILICLFLLREAAMFFPDHHQGLKSYRQGGQELVGYVSDEVDAHTKVYSSANIAYFAEVGRTSIHEDKQLRAYRTVLANVEQSTKYTWARLERYLDEAEDLNDDVEDLREDIEEASADAEADAEDLKKDQAELAEIEARLKQLEPLIAKEREQLEKEVQTALGTSSVWDLDIAARGLSDEELSMVREAVVFEAYPDAEDEHEFIQNLKQVSRDKKAAEAERLADFKETLNGIRDSIRPMKSLYGEMKDISVANRREIDAFSTAPARRAALLAGVEQTDDPAEKERMQKQADEVVIVEPDYDAINEPLYALVPQHGELAGPLQDEMNKLFRQLPQEVETKSARENLKRAAVYYERFDNTVTDNRDRILDWRHDAPLSLWTSTTSFLFGKHWITNSSWHDFYGLLPLFTGSLLISIIALTVSVPFAVAAAIYVNQIARFKEQSFVKPAIEFIGAIPSVVLGFFGILVFGEALRNVSQLEWLQWVPGFPMAERLTILNAGLLLAFMAVPTIFTLTEDALNNVPAAFSENSLALGATKLQTVFRVIVPTAVSGIIAAILLGFGRIIGETMVVLLVAGNKIKIPDFTEGLGVVAQPAHTMTGIIAQELGEVDSGSLHWRALFMVGMVLFVISLLVNWAAQRTLKRLQKI